MTPYSTKDLDEGWEFKIVRSNFATFRGQEKLRAVLEEEKRGGWVLVEKFDDQRIRLKRPAGAKANQGELADGYDPYRTTVAEVPTKLVLTLLGISRPPSRLASSCSPALLSSPLSRPLADDLGM